MHHRFIIPALFVSVFVGCGSTTETAPHAEDAAVQRPSDSPPTAEPPIEEAAVEPPKDASVEIELVQADARKLQNAFLDGDSATFIEFTYPKLIEEMGGAEQAKTEVDDAMAKLQSAGMAIESMTFPEPPTFFSSATQDFVFVPTLATFVVKGQRIESLNFLLGVKPRHASKWTYIDGSQVNDENTKNWLPDFPPGQTHPKTYKKVSP
ncbi:MAG TPA: hypothetical protein VGG30_12770 [Pirellulales bacterium]|jgi:hypothetical protein